MEYITRQVGEQKYIDCAENCLIGNEQAALDLIGICTGEEIYRVMLQSVNLPEDFFRLSSGLAGNILLKFYNYSILVAAVLLPKQVKEGKFYEFALETNRGNQFRIFFSRQKAEEWLTSG
jgi:PadR family transcriptional regulator, regulatory protein AphA